MKIILTKISDQEHCLQVERIDHSTDQITLDTRTFLRHDLAHLAVEIEVPLAFGFWGGVAAGAALSDAEALGKDIEMAESLAGPVQTLLRTDAKVEQYLTVLEQLQPQLASLDLAQRIHERVRQLRGHWAATSFGKKMKIDWPENISNS